METHDYIFVTLVFFSFIIMHVRLLQMYLRKKKELVRMRDNEDFWTTVSAMVFLYGALIMTVIKYFINGEI